jgi:hypothetical protein
MNIYKSKLSQPLTKRDLLLNLTDHLTKTQTKQALSLPELQINIIESLLLFVSFRIKLS